MGWMGTFDPFCPELYPNPNLVSCLHYTAHCCIVIWLMILRPQLVLLGIMIIGGIFVEVLRMFF